MATLNLTVCDGCGRQLTGKEGIADIKRPYLLYNGQLTVCEWNEEFWKMIYLDLTKYNKEALTVCDNACLDTYVDVHTPIVRQRFLKYLRENNK